MERHGSNSNFKPTRLLFFSLTGFSSTLLCFLFYFLVLRRCSSGDSYGAFGGASVRKTFPSLRKVLGSLEDAHLEEGSVTSGEEYFGGTSFRLEVAENATSEIIPPRMVGNIEVASECDVSKGMWVFDESHPQYSDSTCPFIDEGFSCQANGRMDGNYMKWRWKPHDCTIPRFDAAKMLDMLRGKRLVFVGDSINRNQWESILCLLRNGASDPTRVYEAHGRKITKGKGNYSFKFEDYDCTVEFYVSHFLVRESTTRVGHKRKPTLRIDTIDRSSSKWRGADILVFNTAHWWSHHKTKEGKNYYQEKDQIHVQFDVSNAFTRALTTWASWVDQNVNPQKTQVFFRSSSPSHFRGGEWNSGGHCRESIEPLNHTFTRTPPKRNNIVGEILRKMKTPVTLLNITNLSGLRIDGHPSVYGKHPDGTSQTTSQDCSHWCLPGVPDTWNELLYFLLLSKQRTTFTN